MTPDQKTFRDKYLPFALKSQAKTGIDAYVILAQCALETGWGKYCPGNMMFGVKDYDGINGNEQLVPTFEFSSNPNLPPKQIGLDSIKSITLDAIQSKAAGRPIYKYSGMAYFRKYDSPEESFTDHCHVFYSNKDFAPALAVKQDPEKFIRMMGPHYAPGNNTYAAVLTDIYKTLKQQ